MKDTAALIDSIYEAAFVPDAWRPVLHELAKTVGGAGAIFFGEKERALQWVNSPGLDVLVEDWTKGGWHSKNERGERLARVVHSGFVLDSAQFTEEERRTLPVYAEFMRPHGLGTGAGTVIRVPTGDSLLFVVERYLADGDFTPNHVACLDSLRPHLARSALIASRLELQRLKAATEALQVAGLPAAILDGRGKVMACNRLIEALSPQIDIQAFDYLRFAAPGATASLAAALAAVGDRADAASRSFPLPGRPPSPPAVAHLVPLRGEARDLFTGAACFLIVTPLDRRRGLSADTIQGLFDLSPAEARVAEALAQGLTVDRTAETFGISRETVRSHIKSILGKSGASRQADFIASVVSLHVPE